MHSFGMSIVVDADTHSMQQAGASNEVESRAHVHQRIVANTFREAGWKVNDSKSQLGAHLDSLLGIGIDTAGDGRLYVPEPLR